MKTRGVLYIAYGDLFVKEALYSAESVKAQCPDLDITMFSDRMVDSPHIDDCKIISVSHLRSFGHRHGSQPQHRRHVRNFRDF